MKQELIGGLVLCLIGLGFFLYHQSHYGHLQKSGKRRMENAPLRDRLENYRKA